MEVFHVKSPSLATLSSETVWHALHPKLCKSIEIQLYDVHQIDMQYLLRKGFNLILIKDKNMASSSKVFILLLGFLGE